jgi:hypothetical protein
MATFPSQSQFGGSTVNVVAGQNITNHEAWAFTLEAADFNVGALISDISVFQRNTAFPDDVSYTIRLTVVDQNLNPLPPGTGFILGHFESNGV